MLSVSHEQLGLSQTEGFQKLLGRTEVSPTEGSKSPSTDKDRTPS